MKNDLLLPDEASRVFTWRGLRVHQADPVFKIGTDTLLLGGWIPTILNDVSSILDVGTGTGILALMMGRAYPQARITGMDTEEAAVRLARQNIDTQGWADRIEVLLWDVTILPPEGSSSFELLVANPPFFTTGPGAPDPLRAKARHLGPSIEAWSEGMARRLTDHGHIGLVVPYDAAHTWIMKFNALGLYVWHRMDVRSSPDDPRPIRSLLHLQKGIGKMKLTTLCIRKAEGVYTDDYLLLTQIRKSKK